MATVVAVPATEDDVLYRLVRDDRSTDYSFTPRILLGVGKIKSGAMLHHAGLSMFATPEGAVERGGKYPSWVAEVKLPADRSIYVAKTFGPGHYTVWAQVEDLVALATDSGHRA